MIHNACWLRYIHSRNGRDQMKFVRSRNKQKNRWWTIPKYHSPKIDRERLAKSTKSTDRNSFLNDSQCPTIKIRSRNHREIGREWFMVLKKWASSLKKLLEQFWKHRSWTIPKIYWVKFLLQGIMMSFDGRFTFKMV